MTYLELYKKAIHKFELGEITLNEYKDIIKPLMKEIEPLIPCSEEKENTKRKIMYKVMLTDKREVLVDADDFSFKKGSIKLFKNNSVVAFFDSDYIIGVYQIEPPYLFISNEKIWKKEEDE